MVETNHASSRIKGTRRFSTTIVNLFDMLRAPLEAWLDCWVWSLHVKSRQICKDRAIGGRIEFLHWNATSSIPASNPPSALRTDGRHKTATFSASLLLALLHTSHPMPSSSLHLVIKTILYEAYNGRESHRLARGPPFGEPSNQRRKCSLFVGTLRSN